MTGSVYTHVHVGAIARTAHKDPVCFAGFSLSGQEVGSSVILAQSIGSRRVTVTPTIQADDTVTQIGMLLSPGCLPLSMSVVVIWFGLAGQLQGMKGTRLALISLLQS